MQLKDFNTKCSTKHSPIAVKVHRNVETAGEMGSPRPRHSTASAGDVWRRMNPPNDSAWISITGSVQIISCFGYGLSG
jgi:hypothetical protein